MLFNARMESGSADRHGLRLPGATENRRPKTVLVLGGGGMRGMAHVGILRAMQTLGLEYDAIVGTSIGALVGAMAAGGANVDEIEETVSKVQKENTFRLNFVKFLLKGMRTPSVYSGDTFRERLDELEKTLTELETGRSKASSPKRKPAEKPAPRTKSAKNETKED